MSHEIDIKNYETFRQAVGKMEQDLAYHEGELNKKVENLAAKFTLFSAAFSFIKNGTGLGATLGKRVMFVALSRLAGIFLKKMFAGGSQEAMKTGLKKIFGQYKHNIAAFFSNVFRRSKNK